MDAFGNSTTTVESLDPETKTTTITQDVPFSDTDAVSVSINGLLQSRTTPTGLTTTYTYDALDRRIGITDPRTGTSTIHYDSTGQVEYTEDAAGNRTTYTYDPATGRLIGVADAFANTKFIAYTQQGFANRIWGAQVPVSIDYNTYGRMIAMKTWRDANGDPDVTHWNYDEATGLLTNKVYADGAGPSYDYDAAGRLAKRTWARGVETAYAYDFLGQLTGIDYSDTTPDVAFTYDRLGRQLTVTDILGTRTNVYDGIVLQEERMPDGTVLTRSYDALGRPDGISLGDDYTVGYGYDAMGRFASIVAPNEVQMDYSYVPNSDLVAGWSVENGPAAAYAYEPNRNLRTEVANTFDVDPVSSFAYTYDAAGRRTQRVDSDAITNVFGYNLRSELTNAIMPATLPAGGTNLYAYAYDTIGNRQQASANEVTNLYEANELNQYTDINEGAILPTYDADGNITYFGGRNFTWDAENRLVKVRPKYLIEGIKGYDFAYDYRSRRVTKIERRKSMASWPVNWTRTFDYDGWNLIRETETENSEPIEILNGDFSSGLTDWVAVAATAVSCFQNPAARLDDVGSSIEQAVDIEPGQDYVLSFRYHPSGCGAAPGYGSYPYALRILLGDAQATLGGMYAPWTAWNSMSNFTFNLNPVSVAETIRFELLSGIPNGVVDDVSLVHVPRRTTTYVWGLDLSGTLQGAGGVGGLLMQTHSDAAAPWFSFCDANGNVTDLVDDEGTVVAHYEYDPYGNIAAQSGDQADANPFRFSTKYCDDETSLYYYGYRFYSPSLGRWLSRDPIEEKGGFNLYVVVNNRVPNEIDPWGLTNEPPGFPNPDPSWGHAPPPPAGSAAECKAPKVWQERNPSVPPDPNGCSVPWWAGWILHNGDKDNPTGKCSFKDACDQHDNDYADCNKSKAEADEALFQAMVDACTLCNLEYEDYEACVGAAIWYRRMVDWFGGDRYNEAQSEHCECVCP